MGPTSRIDKFRLFCLCAAAILIFPQTLFGYIVLLEWATGTRLPSSLDPLVEVFWQWERFWIGSEHPIPSIPIPGITYPAIFNVLFLFCGDFTRPPPPKILSYALFAYIPMSAFVYILVASGVI